MMSDYGAKYQASPATPVDADRETLLRDHPELAEHYWQDLYLSRRAKNILHRIIASEASALDAIALWNTLTEGQRLDLKRCGPTTVAEINRVFRAVTQRGQ